MTVAPGKSFSKRKMLSTSARAIHRSTGRRRRRNRHCRVPCAISRSQRYWTVVSRYSSTRMYLKRDCQFLGRRDVRGTGGRLEQQVAEIGGVQDLQPLWYCAVEFRALAVGESARLARRDLVRRQAAILPAVDRPGQRARRPSLSSMFSACISCFEQPDLVVGVENGEVRLQPDEFGVTTQNLGGWRGTVPSHGMPSATWRPPAPRRAPSSRARPCW